MKKNESITFSGVWINKKRLHIFAPVSSEGDTVHTEYTASYAKHLYINNPCQTFTWCGLFFNPHAEFIRLRSPLVGGGKAVTKGSSITVGRINPGA